MRIEYDPEADAMYITLIEGPHQVHTVRLNDNVNLDFAEGEVLVGIEVLDARQVLASGGLPSIAVNNLPIVAAA